MNTAAHFIQGINGLVGEVSVRDVAACQSHARLNGFIGILDAVMLLVFVFNVVENLDGFVNVGGFHHDFLKTTFECTIFLNVLAILIERCCADALNLASGKSWLEHVRCIQ